MHFNCSDTTLNMFRDNFRFYNPEEGSMPVSGDRILELYYNFDLPDGDWGSVGNEFVHCKDIEEWLQGMEKVEQGKIERFEKCFYQGDAKQYFLKLTLESVDDKLRLQLSICDGLSIDYDDYINIEQLFSKEEWKTYSDEFKTWNEFFPYQLGDTVRTVEDISCYVKAGKVGIVNEILVNDYLGYSVEYGVAYQAESWNGPYWDGFACDPHQIELVEKNKHS